MACPCGKKASFRRCDAKQVVTGVGHVVVPRRCYACRHSRAKQIPWEAWVGLAGTHRVTPHARRMIVLAGSGCSFDEAARNLAEMSPFMVSNDLMRAVCDEEGRAG